MFLPVLKACLKVTFVQTKQSLCWHVAKLATQNKHNKSTQTLGRIVYFNDIPTRMDRLCHIASYDCFLCQGYILRMWLPQKWASLVNGNHVCISQKLYWFIYIYLYKAFQSVTWEKTCFKDDEKCCVMKNISWQTSISLLDLSGWTQLAFIMNLLTVGVVRHEGRTAGGIPIHQCFPADLNTSCRYLSFSSNTWVSILQYPKHFHMEGSRWSV